MPDPNTTARHPFWQGWYDFAADKQEGDNPHPKGTAAFEAWCHGWEEAYDYVAAQD